MSERLPALSETFTRAEVRGLAAAGLPLRAWSLHPPRSIDPARDASDPQIDDLPSPFGVRVLGAALAQPIAAAAALGTAWAGGSEPWRAGLFLRAPLHVAWGCWLARSVRPGDHVHAQFTGPACSVAWLASRRSGATFSFTAHSEWGMPFLRRKLQDAALVVAISEHERERMLERAPAGFDATKLVVNRLGIEPDRWDEPAPKEPGPFRLLSVGNLGPTKGHDVLLRALAILRDRGVAFEADVVGGGPLEASLRALHDELALGTRVRILGPRPHDEVRALTLRSDACVLACRQTKDGDVDGIPIVLMEAMAAGKAAISTRVSAIPELIEDGVSGRLARPDDPMDLALVIAEVLGDDAARERMGEAARRRIRERFDAKASIERLAALLRPFVS